MRNLRFVLPVLAAVVVVAVALALVSGDDGEGGGSAAPMASSGGSGGDAPQDLTVDIVDFKFMPAEFEVALGGMVTWVNKDAANHSSTSSESATGRGEVWDTGVFGKGEEKTITYEKAGTFDYLCTVHPFMKGTLTVVEGS